MESETAPFSISECYPPELHFVKGLFLQGQYRHCIQTCRDLLKLPDGCLEHTLLHKTFVSFYLALAHDEMARSMHQNSVARLPALNAAVQAYLDAIDSLPCAEDVISWFRWKLGQKQDDPLATQQSTASSGLPSPIFPYATSSTQSSSPSPRSPTFPRTQPPTIMSPAISSHATDSDEELESDDSFSELMTPNRVLRRDFSTMSLLDGVSHAPQLPREASRMSLPDSPSREPRPGLLRQIQQGSSRVTPSRISWRLPEISTRGSPSEICQMASHTQAEPRLGSSRLDHSFTPDPVSPISSLGQAKGGFGTSTTSAVSPPTPVRHDSALATSPSAEDLINDERVVNLVDQIHSLREQLEAHMASVVDLKQKVKVKNTRPGQPTTGTPLGPITANQDCSSSPAHGQARTPLPTSGRIQQARSYWSFVPENVKENAKRSRIENGRERKWARKRFDPSRYRDLCDKALAQL